MYTNLLILNLKEVRRRSEILWQAIPQDKLEWRPEPAVYSVIELVRHVLEDDFFYGLVIANRGAMPTAASPFLNRPITTVADDIAYAKPFRAKLLEIVLGFSAE